MKVINAKVIPNAKNNEIFEVEGLFKIRVTAPATGGRANEAVIEILADFFGVKKSDVRVVRGEKSREKVIEVNTECD